MTIDIPTLGNGSLPATLGNVTERNRQIWRAVVDAGPRGISLNALKERLPGQADGARLKTGLASLRDRGYLRFSGDSHVLGLWHATKKVPKGERVPLWLQEFDGEFEDADEQQPPAAQLPALDKVPSSVFALGDMAAKELGVDIDASHMQDTPAPPAVLPDATVSPGKPLFALYSDGSFWMHLEDDSQPLVLPPDATRELFRYLDRIGRIEALTVMGAA